MSTFVNMSKKKASAKARLPFISAQHLWSQPDVVLKDKEIIPPNYIDGGPGDPQGVNWNGIVYFSDFVPPYGNGDGDRQGDSVELRAVELNLTLSNDAEVPTTWRLILALLNENNTTATSSGIIGDLCVPAYVGRQEAPNSPLGFNAVKSQKYTILIDEVVDVPCTSATYSQRTIRKKLDLGRKKILCQFVPGVVTGTGMPLLYLINDFGGLVAGAPTVTGIVRYHYVSV